MSAPSLDALAAAARNRGLKLVRSRVRTPEHPRFGKAGLTDQTGKPVFGMDLDGPNAAPDAVEAFIRKLETRDWGASLGSTRPATKKGPDKPMATDREQARVEPTRTSRPRAQKELQPQIRSAKPSDTSRLVDLILELGHRITAQQVKNNLAALAKSDETPLVATLEGRVIGLCGLGARVIVHRPAPLGRITILVVTREMQGRGIGRLLVEAAEQWMRKRGCRLVEVTSNDRRTEAHAFYRHLGYERTSIRFAKEL